MEMLVFMVLRGTYLRKKKSDRGNVVWVLLGCYCCLVLLIAMFFLLLKVWN